MLLPVIKMFIMNTLQLPTKSNTFSATDYRRNELVFAKEMKTTYSPDFDKWDLANLTDYIITVHHSYVKKNAAVIYDLAQEVANKHGENHPELLKLTEVSFLFFHDLLNRLEKEERILFPNIKQLNRNRNHKVNTTYTTFGLVRQRIVISYYIK